MSTIELAMNCSCMTRRYRESLLVMRGILQCNMRAWPFPSSSAPFLPLSNSRQVFV